MQTKKEISCFTNQYDLSMVFMMTITEWRFHLELHSEVTKWRLFLVNLPIQVTSRWVFLWGTLYFLEFQKKDALRCGFKILNAGKWYVEVGVKI